MTSAKRLVLRNHIGDISVEPGGTLFNPSDNLTIVLATYFSKHMDRPENDPDDPDLGWGGKWVRGKTEAALDIIARESKAIHDKARDDASTS